MKYIGFKKQKFRGKSKSSDKWIIGDLSNDFGERPIIHNYLIADEEIDDGWNCDGDYVEPNSVGMSTGILDKNKNEIFSGDVYRVEHETEDGDLIEYYICTWLHEFGCFSFLSSMNYNDYIDNGLLAIEWMLNDGFPMHIDFEDCKEIQIIGNVYDMWDFLFKVDLETLGE